MIIPSATDTILPPREIILASLRSFVKRALSSFQQRPHLIPSILLATIASPLPLPQKRFRNHFHLLRRSLPPGDNGRDNPKLLHYQFQNPLLHILLIGDAFKASFISIAVGLFPLTTRDHKKQKKLSLDKATIYGFGRRFKKYKSESLALVKSGGSFLPVYKSIDRRDPRTAPPAPERPSSTLYRNKQGTEYHVSKAG